MRMSLPASGIKAERSIVGELVVWEERRREGLLLKGQVAPKEGDTRRAQATVVEEITSRLLDGAVHCRGW